NKESTPNKASSDSDVEDKNTNRGPIVIAWTGGVLLVLCIVAFVVLRPESGGSPNQAPSGTYLLLLLVTIGPLALIAITMILVGLIVDGLRKEKAVMRAKYGRSFYPLPDDLTLPPKSL
ncbi:MAG TPA: hypothetical protein VL096_05700, partial [Pirellulaceae bacterium]|nr:hypothetical protein [Pirellulaceae bacterium]